MPADVGRADVENRLLARVGQSLEGTVWLAHLPLHAHHHWLTPGADPWARVPRQLVPVLLAFAYMSRGPQKKSFVCLTAVGVGPILVDMNH